MKDWAGWASSVAVTAALFAGGATAALRTPEQLTSGEEPFAVALDLSVGVTPAIAAPTEVAALPETPPDPPPEVEPLPQPVVEPKPVAEQMPKPAPAALPKVQEAQAVAPVQNATPPKVTKPKTPVQKAAAPKKTEKKRPKAPSKTSAAAPAGGSATPAKPATRQKKAGGSDPASYAKSVLRKITKLSRKSTAGKGRAVVGFEIAADGGLKRVMILSASGSAALDKLAMDQIRRAAPFGPPPAGAQRKFSFEFVGK
jgi:periplasmic protein TonB